MRWPAWAQDLAGYSWGSPSPPLGARPGRPRPGTRPGTCPRRGRRLAGSRRVAARHRLRARPRQARASTHSTAPATCATPSTPAPAVPALRPPHLRHHRSRRTRTRRHPEPGVRACATGPSSVLTYCDITTSPDGEHVSARRRLAEIQQRYGPGHLVSRVNPARHPDDPPRSPAGPRQNRPKRLAPQTGRVDA